MMPQQAEAELATFIGSLELAEAEAQQTGFTSAEDTYALMVATIREHSQSKG